MSREAHVRFWEGVGVKLPRATHFIVLSEAHLGRLLRAYRRLLQHRAATPIARQQQSPATRAIEPPPDARPDHRHSSGRWAPSPLPARRLITATATPLWLAPSTVVSAAGSPCGPSHLRRCLRP